MAKGITKRRREIHKLGWETEVTKGGHLRCTHPHATYAVFASSTPSDRREWLSLVSEMRRAIAERSCVSRAFCKPKREGNIAVRS